MPTGNTTIRSACIYALRIPFARPFRHAGHERDRSDSVVVRVTTGGGVSGYGEGVPRPYVTGETVAGSVEHISRRLLPRVLGADLDVTATSSALRRVHRLLPEQACGDGVVWNASRCAVELAVVDCLLRCRGVSLGATLPARGHEVTYSGVIGAGAPTTVAGAAHRYRASGFQQIKLKVGRLEDLGRVVLVRDIMGPSVSIRLDANGAFSRRDAEAFLPAVAAYGIDCVEQPLPRGDPSELAALRSVSPVPLMADESVVTLRDAKRLIETEAVDYLNLRLSKCGGLHDTLAMAELARSAGVRLQLGCHVGETAVLWAAGRHMAAHLADLRFVEGSFGSHLLAQDVSEEDVVFGPGGRAPVLAGPGLGIAVRDELLDVHACAAIRVPG